jgi:hypothetical protein
MVKDKSLKAKGKKRTDIVQWTVIKKSQRNQKNQLKSAVRIDNPLIPNLCCTRSFAASNFFERLV